MRIAILGAARIAGKALIEPVRDLGAGEVRAIGASSAARARDFAATHDIPVAGSYGAVFDRDDIDLVYIALPPAQHAAWAVAAARAGKHVLVEKPSATCAAEASAMVAAAEAAGVRLIEAFHYAWHPLYRRAQELVASGAIGAVTAVEARFSVPIARSPDEFRWRADLGGGALADLGCYTVHWVRGLVAGQPRVMRARQRIEQGVDAATEALLLDGSGAELSVQCDMDPPRRAIHLSITGTLGRIAIDNPLAPQFGHRLVVSDAAGNTREEQFPRRATFSYQIEGVITALRSGAPVRPEGADIVANMALMDAIRAQAATTIPPDAGPEQAGDSPD